MALKIVFAGTPEFAIPSFRALMEEHHVLALYTKPDSPTGRGRRLVPSSLKQFSLDHYPGLPILQPPHLLSEEVQAQLANFQADLMVVIAYGIILPKAILSLFKYGCINVHASLLPRWRGAAPIQRALLEGDKETGVTIMQINEGLDTGDILQVRRYLIEPTETTKTLHEKLAQLGAEALSACLQKLIHGKHPGIPQDNTLATYAAKIKKDEALIDWQNTAIYLERKVRAFNSWPIVYTYLNNLVLKIWEAEVVSTETHAMPGMIIKTSQAGIEVATGQGVLRLLQIQIPGGRPMPAGDFLNARAGQVIPFETVLHSC